MKIDNNDIYLGKLKAYNDGFCRVIMYKQPRVKPSKLSFNSMHGSASAFDAEMDEEERQKRLEESRECHMWEVINKIKDYGRNNDFTHFWTLTFDPKIVGLDNNLRFELMKKWLHSERRKARKKGLEFRYLFVPELHTGDGVNGGTIHFHGITGGYTPQLLDSGKKFKGVCVYNCSSWQHGFSNIQKVRSKKKIVIYISKYITKDLINSPVIKGKKKYWASKNLQLPHTEYVTRAKFDDYKPNFECDVCKVYEVPETLIGTFIDR